MPPVGVGENWKGSIAERCVLDLTGTHAKDVPRIQAAIEEANAAVPTLEAQVAALQEKVAKLTTDLGIADEHIKAREAQIVSLEESILKNQETVQAARDAGSGEFVSKDKLKEAPATTVKDTIKKGGKKKAAAKAK